MGSIASHGSGDIFIAFATGNRGLGVTGTEKDPRRTVEARMVVDKGMSPLFQAAVEAVEAAVVNALLAAETLTGRDGITAHAIDHGRLLDVMAKYGRGPRAAGPAEAARWLTRPGSRARRPPTTSRRSGASSRPTATTGR